MSTERKIGSVNQIIKGEVIFERGAESVYVGLVLKGRVRIQTEGVNLVIGSGHFLGLTDLPDFIYRTNYIAETDCAIYIFRGGELHATIQNIINANKDYAPLMVTTLGKYVYSMTKLFRLLEEKAEENYEFLREQYEQYNKLGQFLGIETDKIQGIEELSPLMNWSALDESKIEYYNVCSLLKQEVQKAFYGASEKIAMYHATEQVDLLRSLLERCEADAKYLQSLAGPLIRTDKNLYKSTMQLVTTARRTDPSDKQGMELFDKIIDQINNIEDVLFESAGIDLQIDHESMDKAYYRLMNADSLDSSDDYDLVEDTAVSVDKLKDSMSRILQFSGLPEEDTKHFASLIEQFGKLGDKMSGDDDVRQLRRDITKNYYPLYHAIFLKDYHSEEETPLEVDLFLRYGFISETLLTEELLEDLLAFDTYYSGQGDCRVYDMKEWLTEIYEGRKEPSKSEFDMDYEDYLRDLKKTGQITDAQMKEQMADQEAKLKYEVDNMFKSNHKLVSGQISIFVPFLYTEGCGSSLLRTYLTKDKVSACTRRLRQIDYSVFYREIIFVDETAAIKKEAVMEEVAPDFILMPGCGSNGIMWQELSGRRRNSKGRFLLPQFFEGELDETMIKLFGRFRWELCRTMMGSAWNNIQMKSLTSEYSDYIQFYRKNRDLSEDRKEKLKMQIQKCRNNTREVFVVDYSNWIRLESKGGITLNKIAREILATYCPFPKQIRESVSEQPMFRDAMARFIRETGKKNKEYSLKFRVWEKDDLEIPQEIVQTRDFYRDF
ncbi:MAG: Crp/Fnr family transcriptional regulator [Lachnospiraceae bacterium]|nr:Crp/Fnr family transcriptional regulator [Lachnospiraceae bacterium]